VEDGVSTGLVEDTPVVGGTTSLLVDDGVAEALSVDDETLAVIVAVLEEAAVALLEAAELAA
jgi:predicted HTH domain antitoxin